MIYTKRSWYVGKFNQDELKVALLSNLAMLI